MDDRISALSAQIAELSKKIETVSSGSGGSSWAGELAYTLWLSSYPLILDAVYTSKIKLAYQTFRNSAHIVNPTNRDCILLADTSGGKLVSSSHGDVPLNAYRFDEGGVIIYTGLRGTAQLSKGAYLSYSGSGGILNIYYLIIEN
ncbi:TPA: hypothetical protein ACIKY6_001923 [Campylobacter jejuni]